MRLQLKKTISFKAGTKDNWSEDDSDSCSHYSISTKQSAGSASSFDLRSLQSRITRISIPESSFSSSPESLDNENLLDYEDYEDDSHSGSHYSGSAKQSTMSLAGFSLKSLQSKVSRGASIDNSSSSSLSSRSPGRGSVSSSFNSLHERFAFRNYDKMDEDHFDISLVLDKALKDCDDFDCCQGSSFRTLPTVVDSSSDEEEDEDEDSSLDDEEPVQSSALCHLPSGMEGLVHVMINTKDPTYATIWVKSPNSARQHLELNITPTTRKAQKTRKARRGPIRPPVRSLVVPLGAFLNPTL
jgi:hypothetical protein